MKRAEILEKLNGVEKADEIVDFIMSENGKDIEKAKSDTTRYKDEISKLQESLKNYEKGGEKYIDAEEFNRLKTFETDTLNKQFFDKKNTAVLKWLKDNNASEKALKLLTKAVDINSVEFAEDGSIKNADKLFGSIKNDYKDFFVTTEQGGATAGNPPIQKTTEKQPANLAEAVKEKLNKQGE